LLSDFGLAMLSPRTLSASTQAMDQSLTGTITYLAPEQLQGKARPASDQYALGVVVYEWLCGTPPFRGSPIEVAMQHLSVPPASLHEPLPDLAPAIEEVVLRALAKEPELRFNSVQDFATALQHSWHETLYPPIKPESIPPSSVDFPPLTTLENRSGNLPTQATPFIGREKEMAAVRDLLCREDIRLLTLTGVGGTGKTRLALQVSAEFGDLFIDGVYFVNLAPIRDPDFVVPTIALTLGIREVADQLLLERLREELQQKQLLLLLDNFEQVVSAAPGVVDLLVSCPKLKILVTSREVLRVRAEHEFAVPPLALPDLARLPELAELPHYAAVALFIQRAQAVQPDFQLTPANARTIAEICLRLDGLPLAIELAAARVKLLSPQSLLARLNQRLQILTSGPRDAPMRHQSLRNTIAWSYDLLNPWEQQLFRLLSVFTGGCTLEAVEGMCAALDGSDATTSALDGVSSLIDKSLLQRTRPEEHEPRLLMLETIREYGLETLATSGEMENTRQAHAGYFLALAEEAQAEISGPQQAVWLERLEHEHDNLRAALQWSLEQGEADQRVEIALRISRALAGFWKTRGHYSEGRTFLKRVLARSEGNKTSLRAEALNIAAGLAAAQGDYGESEMLGQESLAMSRQLEDTRNITTALFVLADVAVDKDDLHTARTLMEEALTLSRELGDKKEVAKALFELGWQAKNQEQYPRARALLEEALAMHRELGDTGAIAHTLFQLAEVLYRVQGNPATVHSLLEESLALFREVGDKEGTAYVFDLSGEIALNQGDLQAARPLLETALALYREIGDLPAMSWTLYGAAFGAKAQREFEWAAELWGAAEAMREARGASLPSVERANYERAVAAVRARLGEEAFAATWSLGRNMTPEQALAAQAPGLAQISGELPTIPTATTPPTYPDGLTAREVEVLRLVAQGLSNVQVAEQLVISPRTVNTHLTSIYGKIQAPSRSAATRYAIEHKLI
jgi:predicted ATPase/DNA-binding CsgD family transcriptional regulator